MHQTQSPRYRIGFLNEKSAGRRYKQCVLLDKSSRKMYTIFSAVLRQQRKCDVMTYFGRSDRSAVYYKADSPLPVNEIRLVQLTSNQSIKIVIFKRSNYSALGILMRCYLRRLLQIDGPSGVSCRSGGSNADVVPQGSQKIQLGSSSMQQI
jgi:hypothetical protein